MKKYFHALDFIAAKEKYGLHFTPTDPGIEWALKVHLLSGQLVIRYGPCSHSHREYPWRGSKKQVRPLTLGHVSEQNRKNVCPHETYILVGRTDSKQ